MNKIMSTMSAWQKCCALFLLLHFHFLKCYKYFLGFDTNSNVEGVETLTITVCFDTITSTNIWSRPELVKGFLGM